MPEQEREFVVDAAFAVGQIRVADAAGDDVDHHLTGPGIGDDDVDQLDGLLLGSGDHTAHCLTHGVQPSAYDPSWNSVQTSVRSVLGTTSAATRVVG